MIDVTMRRTFVHVLLFACLLFEMLEIEVVQDGFLHHFLDGIVVLAYGFVARAISQKLGVGLLVLAMGVAPWLLDLSQLTFGAFDVESILWGVLHGTLAVIVGTRLMRVPVIRFPEMCDVTSIFLLTGFAFAALYSALLGIDPSALNHALQGPGEPIGYGDVLYFSFVTQLTVGFGDMAPVSSAARVLCIFQALFGVMYVATLIAKFVSLHTTEPK